MLTVSKLLQKLLRSSPTLSQAIASINPIGTVTELRNKHAQGEMTAGINVRKGCITNILSSPSITLASETVRSILKIYDIVNTI